MSENIRTTYSICPICGKQVVAEVIKKDDGVYLEKNCPEHGDFSVLIWKNKIDILSWYGEVETIKPGENSQCPEFCAENGLCSEHQSSTCCTLFEVTERCNLKCKFCFANKEDSNDKSIDEICKEMKQVIVKGETLLQLSGGEPTMRDDLPQIVTAARELGCKYVQLNTNGIRLAEDEDYVKKLSDAGLSFVFMQFDGIDDEIYVNLRGKPLFALKEKAIDNCAKYNLGVTLVPTIVPGVNSMHIGEILRYGVMRSPSVRGVHFQPVGHLGRIPSIPQNNSRFTLDELLFEVENQSGGLIKTGNLQPAQCDHPMCGFHGDFIVKKDRTLYPLTVKRNDTPGCCCGVENPASRKREFVGRRWKRAEVSPSSSQSCVEDLSNMDYFLSRVSSHGFTITSMAFQDAGNIDIERLRMCRLHVAKNGKLIPFCVNYLTLWTDD